MKNRKLMFLVISLMGVIGFANAQQSRPFGYIDGTVTVESYRSLFTDNPTGGIHWTEYTNQEEYLSDELASVNQQFENAGEKDFFVGGLTTGKLKTAILTKDALYTVPATHNKYLGFKGDGTKKTVVHEDLTGFNEIGFNLKTFGGSDYFISLGLIYPDNIGCGNPAVIGVSVYPEEIETKPPPSDEAESTAKGTSGGNTYITNYYDNDCCCEKQQVVVQDFLYNPWEGNSCCCDNDLFYGSLGISVGFGIGFGFGGGYCGSNGFAPQGPGYTFIDQSTTIIGSFNTTTTIVDDDDDNPPPPPPPPPVNPPPVDPPSGWGVVDPPAGVIDPGGKFASEQFTSASGTEEATASSSTSSDFTSVGTSVSSISSTTNLLLQLAGKTEKVTKEEVLTGKTSSNLNADASTSVVETAPVPVKGGGALHSSNNSVTKSKDLVQQNYSNKGVSQSKSNDLAASVVEKHKQEPGHAYWNNDSKPNQNLADNHNHQAPAPAPDSKGYVASNNTDAHSYNNPKYHVQSKNPDNNYVAQHSSPVNQHKDYQPRNQSVNSNHSTNQPKSNNVQTRPNNVQAAPKFQSRPSQQMKSGPPTRR